MRLFACLHAPALEALELISLQERDLDNLTIYCRTFPDYPRPLILKLFNTSSRLYDTLFRLFPTITILYINHSFGSVEPVLSQLPSLRSITYNHMPLFQNSYTGPTRLVYLDYVEWIFKHVQDCHDTPQAMRSVRIGYSARLNRNEENYQTLQSLVDLVELADEDESLQDSWSADEETESEAEADDDDGIFGW